MRVERGPVSVTNCPLSTRIKALILSCFFVSLPPYNNHFVSENYIWQKPEVNNPFFFSEVNNPISRLSTECGYVEYLIHILNLYQDKQDLVKLLCIFPLHVFFLGKAWERCLA